MKNLLLAASAFLVFGSVANAASYKLYPQVYFPEAVFVDNVCTTGETLRTINPVKVCYSVEVKERKACVVTDNQEICRVLKEGEVEQRNEVVREIAVCTDNPRKFASLEMPVKYTTQECTQYAQVTDTKNLECLAWTPTVKSWPMTYRVQIVDNDGDQSFRSHGFESFKLPLCGKR